ncbi:MAG: D-alanyl-D-alanine carboxypeptidase [Lactobacillus sp.]|jgi:D-alanyl-D-alanine carboxypeptidase (penicillin-binding protein 5/6)|nr:D-alanyl-D-alanine carboxypeptidase [Lactobacillus sp.]
MFCFSIGHPVQAVSNYQTGNLSLQVKGAIAIDQKTGQVLYAKNAKRGLPIASLTKMMTIYLTLKAIKDGRLSWSQKVTAPAAAIANTSNSEFANVPLLKHHRYTIRQLYQATLIESANGAAMTLAQAVGGKQAAFIDEMNAQARKWHLTATHFYTSCGLANQDVGNLAYPGASGKAQNYASAQALATIARHLITDFPQVLQTTKIRKMNFVDGSKVTVMTNWNKMLPGQPYASSRFVLDGLKTGTTDEAGACFTGTTIIKGRRVITVVLGAANDAARFRQTEKLLVYIADHYGIVNLKKYHLTASTAQGHSLKAKLKKVSRVWDPLDGSNLKLSLQTAPSEPVLKNQELNTGTLSSGQTKLLQLTKLKPWRVEAISQSQVGKLTFWGRVKQAWHNFLMKL